MAPLYPPGLPRPSNPPGLPRPSNPPGPPRPSNPPGLPRPSNPPGLLQPSNPQGNTARRYTTTTRDAVAIFGERWVMAAQRAGRGMDMGGFPMDDAYATAIANIRDTPLIGVVDYPDKRTTTDYQRAGRGMDMGGFPMDDAYAAAIANIRGPFEEWTPNGRWTPNTTAPLSYGGPSSTTAPPQQSQQSQARSVAAHGDNRTTTDHSTFTDVTDQWTYPNCWTPNPISPLSYGGPSSATAPPQHPPQSQARSGTAHGAAPLLQGARDLTTTDLGAARRNIITESLAGFDHLTHTGRWTPNAMAPLSYGGASSTTVTAPRPQHPEQPQARSGTAQGAFPLLHGARDLTTTNLGAARRSISTGSLAGSDGSNYTVSANYQGDISLPENISAAIPLDQSTSLFIRGMGPSVTFRDILNAIRNTGRVYSLFLNPPNGTHFGSAAKICFFTRAAAETFFNNTRNGFMINGDHSAEVLWNRVLVSEHNRDHWRRKDWKNACRVVLVRGPKQFVNRANILGIINRGIRMYDLERITVDDYLPTPGFSQIEMHFGSFRAQGHSAFIILSRELEGKDCKIFYGVDPCE